MSAIKLFLLFLRLGCTSFGGPVAHISYFREAFVVKRQWLSEQDYSQLVALCQFLPGPASSQVGMAIGYRMAGQAGCFAAWLGFTLPSALLMLAFAMGLASFSDNLNSLIQSFLLVAVVIVAHAVWGMWGKLCQSGLTKAIAIASALALFVIQLPFVHILVLIIAGLVASHISLLSQVKTTLPSLRVNTLCVRWFSLFLAFLVSFPLLRLLFDSDILAIADITYRSGALVFGGGHVVLPLLQAEIVNIDGSEISMREDTFLSGYGLAQAMPGPLFSFATFIGAAVPSKYPVLAGIVATICIFLPGYLLLMASLPIISHIQQHPILSKALIGINASVVGILLAAFVDPIVTKGINSVVAGAIALIGFYWINNLKRPVLEVMGLVIGLSLLASWISI